MLGESNKGVENRNEPPASEEQEGTSKAWEQAKPEDNQSEQQDPYPVFRPWVLAYWLDSVKSLIL